MLIFIIILYMRKWSPREVICQDWNSYWKSGRGYKKKGAPFPFVFRKLVESCSKIGRCWHWRQRFSGRITSSNAESCFITCKSFSLPCMCKTSDSQCSLLLQGWTVDTPGFERWVQGIPRFSLWAVPNSYHFPRASCVTGTSYPRALCINSWGSYY